MNQLMNVAQHLEQVTHARQWQHVWTIRWRSLGRVVNFHEHCIDATRHAGAREWFDVLGQTARSVTRGNANA